MKTRFIRKHERKRFMLRGPFTEETVQLSKYIISMGYTPVTFVQYWKHVLFWWRKPKNAPSPQKK